MPEAKAFPGSAFAINGINNLTLTLVHPLYFKQKEDQGDVA